MVTCVNSKSRSEFLRGLGSSHMVLLALLLGSLLVGCAAGPTVKIRPLQAESAGYAVIPADNIKVYRANSVLDQPFEVLAVISAIGENRSIGNNEEALKLMQQQASALGANALLGYYSDEVLMDSQSNSVSWSSAIAVRTLKQGEKPRPVQTQAIVSIPHVGAKTFDLQFQAVADKYGRKFAQYYLAKRGYYTRLLDISLPDTFPDVPQSVQAFGPADSDMILGIRFLAMDKSMYSGAQTAIETAIYSKSSNSLIYQKNVSGLGWTDWPGNDSNESKQIQAVRDVVEKAFAVPADVSAK